MDAAGQPAHRDHPDGPVRIHRRTGRRHHRRPARDRPGPGAPRAQSARAEPARRTRARPASPGAAMSHHPEQLAAAYLATMRPRARRRFEAHLLACEPCWQEVCLARRGRQLAETARDLAPAELREDIRAAIATAATLPAASPLPLRRIVVAAVAVAVLRRPPAPPPARAHRLPPGACPAPP